MYYSAKDQLDIAGHAIAQKDNFSHAIFQNRFEQMAREVLWDGNGFSDVTDVRIAKGWPTNGTARFTRATDGVRFKVYMTKKNFKVEQVKGDY